MIGGNCFALLQLPATVPNFPKEALNLRRLLIPLAILALAWPVTAEKSALELITLSAKPNDEFRAALIETMGQEKILQGTAWAGQGPDFIFAVEAGSSPTLFVDEREVGKMRRVKGWNMWFYNTRLSTGTSHSFHYEIDGRRNGGLTDIPAYLPECYAQGGVPQGALSEKLTHTSQIYRGMTSDYWIYVPAQYDPATPAALMVWQDGHNHVERDGKARTLNVIDNLTHEKKIPVMITVFVSPGMVGEKRMRSTQYDRIGDTYARFLRDEILPEVEKKYNFRNDAYSRAIAGVSSGGICAFNAAWQMPDQFSRVLSLIGSYTSIAGVESGGHLYPFKVRKENVRNIRVWLQDGSGDLENAHGSWPLMNIQLANSLKFKGYDFYFSFGNGTHNTAHGLAELPRSLEWIWRGYDPALQQEVYVIDPEEKKRPLFRVDIANR